MRSDPSILHFTSEIYQALHTNVASFQIKATKVVTVGGFSSLEGLETLVIMVVDVWEKVTSA